jgi:hypothetical protein
MLLSHLSLWSTDLPLLLVLTLADHQFMKGLAGVDLRNTGVPTLEEALKIYIAAPP